MSEQQFLPGEFAFIELPEEKAYLLKYFRNNNQKLFVRYFCTFGNYDGFCSHTGVIFSDKWLSKLKKKVEVLEGALLDAKVNNSTWLIAKIKSGKYKLNAK